MHKVVATDNEVKTMADEIKRVQVKIGSMTYSLVSAEDEQYTRQIAARADEMIRRVQQGSPQLSQSMATVLALVNSVDDLTRMYDKSKYEDQRQTEIDKQISEIRQELQKQREQNWDLKKDILELRQTCRQYEKELGRWRQMGEAYQISPEDEARLDDGLVKPSDTKASIENDTTRQAAADLTHLNRSADQVDVDESAGLSQTNDSMSQDASGHDYQWESSNEDQASTLSWQTVDDIEITTDLATDEQSEAANSEPVNSEHASHDKLESTYNDEVGINYNDEAKSTYNDEVEITYNEAPETAENFVADRALDESGSSNRKPEQTSDPLDKIGLGGDNVSPEALEAAPDDARPNKKTRPPFASGDDDASISLAGTSARRIPRLDHPVLSAEEDKLELGSLKQTNLDDYLLQQSKKIQKRDPENE